MLPVAIVAPAARPLKPTPSFVTRTSFVLARGNVAVISSSSGCSLGRSFALCTATSMRPTSNSFSISRVNMPLRPALRSITGARCRPSSPLVRIMSMTTSSFGHAFRSAVSTMPACANASSLPRDPRMMRFRASTQLSETRKDDSPTTRSRAAANQSLKSFTCPAMISSPMAICSRRKASDCWAIDCNESMS